MFMKSQIQMIWISSFTVILGDLLGSLSFSICNLSISLLSPSLSFSWICYFSSYQFVFSSTQRSMTIFVLFIHRSENVLVLFSSNCCWDCYMEFNVVEKCGVRYISMIIFKTVVIQQSKYLKWIQEIGAMIQDVNINLLTAWRSLVVLSANMEKARHWYRYE